MGDLTAEMARDLVRYEPDTGGLYWRTSGKGVIAGEPAGHLRRVRGRYSYWGIGLAMRQYRAHRVIWLMMTGKWPKGEIDHIDGNALNNRWANLRVVSRRENMLNRAVSSNNKCGHMGVYWDKSRGKWCAKIKVFQRNKYLGRFDSLEDAVNARKEAELFYGFHRNHGRPLHEYEEAA